MSPLEQLKMRALRILHDGKKHSEAAILWAMELTGVDPAIPPEVAGDAAQRGFTLRELSLGAGHVA